MVASILQVAQEEYRMNKGLSIIRTQQYWRVDHMLNTERNSIRRGIRVIRSLGGASVFTLDIAG